jgi:hypothetical protein
MKTKLKKALCIASCCCAVFSWGCTGPTEPSSVNISISAGNTYGGEGEAEENKTDKTVQSEGEDEDGPPLTPPDNYPPPPPPPPIEDPPQEPAPDQLTLYTATEGMYFQRRVDSVIFGPVMKLLPEDSIKNYTEIYPPPYIDPDVRNENTRIKYIRPIGDGDVLMIDIFERGSYDRFELQPDGPQRDYPVGRWVSTTNPQLHEELIISESTLFRYSDALPDLEYRYMCENEYFYVRDLRYITVWD